MPPRFQPARRSVSAGTRVVLVATVLALAWGAFAFGAVYPWAYTPLAACCAMVGLAGLATGNRPIPRDCYWLLAALFGVGLVGLLQMVPLPGVWLEAVSPGTVAFLRRYDLRFAYAVDLESGLPVFAAHAISLEPVLTMRALWLFAALALLFLGLCRSLSRTAAGWLTRGVVAVGFVLALVGIGQKVFLGDHAFGGMRIYGFWKPESLLTTPFGPYVNKNHFAGWMLMGIPLAFALVAARLERARHRLQGQDLSDLLVWCSEPEGGRMLAWLTAALFMTLALVMTGSRSGIGGLVVIAGLLLASARRVSSMRTLVVLAIIGVGGLLAVAAFAGTDVLGRFARGPESVALRLSIWRVSIDVIRQFPILGTGLNTFGRAMVVFQPAAGVHYVEAHNEYLQILVEGGLVTFGLVMLAIGSAVRASAARFAGATDGLEARWLRTGAVIGLVAIALQSFVEFSLQMPGNAAMFVVLLAMALYLPAPLVGESPPAPEIDYDGRARQTARQTTW